MMQSVDSVDEPWDTTALDDTELAIRLQPVKLTLAAPEIRIALEARLLSARTQALEAFCTMVTARVCSIRGVLMKSELKKRGTFCPISTSIAWLVWCVPEVG